MKVWLYTPNTDRLCFNHALIRALKGERVDIKVEEEECGGCQDCFISQLDSAKEINDALNLKSYTNPDNPEPDAHDINPFSKPKTVVDAVLRIIKQHTRTSISKEKPKCPLCDKNFRGGNSFLFKIDGIVLDLCSKCYIDQRRLSGAEEIDAINQQNDVDKMMGIIKDEKQKDEKQKDEKKGDKKQC